LIVLVSMAHAETHRAPRCGVYAKW